MSKRKNNNLIDKENIKQKRLGKLIMKINIVWAVLAFVGVIIGGLNQYNHLVVGLVAISEGVLGILLFISHIIVLKKGMIPITDVLAVLLESNMISFSSPTIFEKYEDEFEKAKLGNNIFLGAIMFFSIIAIVAGILKIIFLI